MIDETWSPKRSNLEKWYACLHRICEQKKDNMNHVR